MSKKRSDGVNFQSQQENLNAVDRAIMGDLSAMDIRSDIENEYGFTDANFVDGIFGMLEERKKYRSEHPEESVDWDEDLLNVESSDDDDDSFKEFEGDVISQHPILEYIDTKNPRNAIVMERQPDNAVMHLHQEVEENHSKYNMITINRRVGKDGAFDIVDISDGVRIISIDLATLERDTTTLDELYDNIEDRNTIPSMTFTSICANLYPGMMISKERFDSYARHIAEFETDYHNFYEYDDGNNNFIVGYRTEDDFADKYISICDDLEEKGIIISFLKTLVEMTSMDGICFRTMSSGRIKQVMLTEYMSQMSKEFVDDFMSDDEIIVKDTDVFNDSANDVIPILPYDFLSHNISRLFDDDSDESDDIEDDEDDDELEDEESESYDESDEEDVEETSEDIEEEEDIESETSEDLVEEPVNETPVVEETHEEPEESSDDLFDDVEDAGETESDMVEEPEEVKEIGGYSVDPEEAEADYYASRGQKPPKPSAPKKPKPSEQDEDSKWIIQRR